MSNDKVKRRNHPDVVMAHAQIGLTFVLLFATLALVGALIFLHNDMSSQTFSLISNAVVALITLLTLSWQYFFARQRPVTLPDNTTGSNAPITTGGTVSVTRDESRTVSG